MFYYFFIYHFFSEEHLGSRNQTSILLYSPSCVVAMVLMYIVVLASTTLGEFFGQMFRKSGCFLGRFVSCRVSGGEEVLSWDIKVSELEEGHHLVFQPLDYHNAYCLERDGGDSLFHIRPPHEIPEELSGPGPPLWRRLPFFGSHLIGPDGRHRDSSVCQAPKKWSGP